MPLIASSPYLASFNRAGKRRYEIRQSFFDQERQHYRHRRVFDLGTDPTSFIFQVSDDICYFVDELRDCLEVAINKDPTVILEELLWDFLPAEEQRRLERFRYRGTTRLSPLSAEDRAAIDQDVQLFDRRRLYYLRYGAVDQSRLARLNPKLYRPLLRQSRDEREYYFRSLERALHANELKTYVFAIFDLQRHFDESFSPTMPEALNQIDIADHFIADICRLNDDLSFWGGDPPGNSLHQHLVRYLIMFFDHGYGRRSLFDDFLREFMGRHRAFRWPERKPALSTGRIEKVFAVPWPELQKMNKKELTKRYRQRATQLHPDSGGNHDRFVELHAAYVSLMVHKK